MARVAKPIEVGLKRKQELLMMSRSQKLERWYVDRAKVILLSLEHKTLDQIMEQVNMSRRSVNKWRDHFRRFGIDG